MSESLTTNHELPGSIPGSTVRIFPEGEDSVGDHGLGRLVEFRFKGPPGTTSSYITHSHHRDNVTAPYGRPNLRSRLHCCHAQEGGPRSPQGHVVALDQNKNAELYSVFDLKAFTINCIVHTLTFVQVLIPIILVIKWIAGNNYTTKLLIINYFFFNSLLHRSEEAYNFAVVNTLKQLSQTLF